MTTKKRLWFDISVGAVIGAIIVLAIISGVMGFKHFQRQQEQAVELLIEKGATLIRSFEAGLRSSLSAQNDLFVLQKLLMETAQQQDIDYIIVTDDRGSIIADTDPTHVGDQYGLDLDTGSIILSGDIQWRKVVNTGGAGTFEVYREFFLRERTSTDVNRSNKDDKNTGRMIIYVGLNMDVIEKAIQEDTRHTVIVAIILLLVGSSIIVSLFLMQANRAAQSSLARLTIFSDALIKNMPVGLIAQDHQGVIIACNENAQALLDVSCHDALGKDATDLLPVSLLDMLSGLPQIGGLSEKDIPWTSSDGKEQIWEAVAAGIIDEGKAAGKILLVRNVTQARNLEKEVTKSRHLNSIGSLAAGVAHEIRNPLSSLKGFAAYFKERLSGNKEDQQTADVMIQEVERLNRVIGQLIEFAKPLALKKERSHVPELIQHTVNLISSEMQKNKISVAMETSEAVPAANIDPDKIKQVFLNIFLNAIAALPSGGQIKIRLSSSSDGLVVVISDNGTGIKKADMPQLYDPYFTSKPAGTGLGLAMVQKIMDAHGGNIHVESNEDKGTDVFLTFPLSSA